MTATSKNKPTLVDVPVLDAIAQEFLRHFLKLLLVAILWMFPCDRREKI
jgi:hypothetical protein